MSPPEGRDTLPLNPAMGPGTSDADTDGSEVDSGDGEPAGELPTLESVLVFTRTTGFRHDSIGAGVELLQTLGGDNGFAVEQTEDPTAFTDERLATHDVVVFLNTTGDVLDEPQQAAFERYIRAGGGWVGVHSASDTEYDWEWYGQLIGGGAYFLSHPPIQTATLDREAADHPSTAHLPERFPVLDEWYNFRENPRGSVTVLLTLDEATYQPGEGNMGADHPIAWYHEFDGGRAWYTALGHRNELYQGGTAAELTRQFQAFSQHLLGGIRWAAGVAP